MHGETDDIGYGAVRNRVSIQDWHATILHQLGMDHEKLTVDRNGLEERLTHLSHPCGERNSLVRHFSGHCQLHGGVQRHFIDPQGQSSVLAAFAEEFGHQIGGAIEHLRMSTEPLGAMDVAFMRTIF